MCKKCRIASEVPPLEWTEIRMREGRTEIQPQSKWLTLTSKQKGRDIAKVKAKRMEKYTAEAAAAA
jgi:hypothetical protein